MQDLRAHFSHYPAVLRLLHHAFVACSLLRNSRLADTIRYVQQYLVSAEEQESGQLRAKLKAGLLGLSPSRCATDLHERIIRVTLMVSPSALACS